MMYLSKHRFEFFSDGVMAIIMTIMVLEIPLPENFSHDAIIHFIKSIIIFFASFFIVGTFWNRHHRLIDSVEKIVNNIVWKNLLFLFFISLLPLFTKWFIENPNKLIPAIAYDILFLFTNFIYMLMFRGTLKRKEINNDIQNRRKIKLPWYRIITPIIILIGLIVLTIVFPQVSMVLFIGIPILISLSNIIPDHNRRFRRNINEKNNGVRGNGV